MKALGFALAILLGLVLNYSQASATERAGSISNDVLAQMGLDGMDEVSDEAGMDIRGKGYSHRHHGHHHHGHHHHGHHHKHKHHKHKHHKHHHHGK